MNLKIGLQTENPQQSETILEALILEATIYCLFWKRLFANQQFFHTVDYSEKRLVRKKNPVANLDSHSAKNAHLSMIK